MTLLHAMLIVMCLSAGALGAERAMRPQPFPLSAVQLLEGPFQHASRVNERYVLSLDPDRLLAPFLIDAGLEPRAPRYGNWESMGLDGHTGGHYLTALSLLVATTGSQEARARLDHMVRELARAQAANGDGYVGGIPGGRAMWAQIARGEIDASTFSLNGRWVPLYNLHKLFAGLRDAWLLTGHRGALDVLIGLADWGVALAEGLTDEQMQRMLISEHGGMNEVLADLYTMTGNAAYLNLAKRFSHQAILTPLLQSEDQLTGLHANTQIPKVIGFMRIAQITGNRQWEDASAFFWDNVVNRRSVAIGGNSVYEHFHPTNDFSPMIESRQGPETCNTYNMLKLTQLLYQSRGHLKYIDYYERALYNHILSSQHPAHGGLVYFTPMRPQHYRVYSNPQETFWCCVGSGIESHFKYGRSIYAHHQDDLLVNLFIPSILRWEERGLTVTQTTQFPHAETTTLRLTLNSPSRFAIGIRHPSWVKPGQLRATVNGKRVRVRSVPGQYLTITRRWRTDDEIQVTLPMHTHGELLPDGQPYKALLHGPIVLAAKVGSQGLDGLIADGSRMGHVAHGPLHPRDQAPMLVIQGPDWPQRVAPVPGQTLTFRAPELIYPQSAQGLELIPFYQLHDARYMLYWRTTTPAGLEAIRAELALREKERLRLDSLTIGRVIPGQQQPEAEHNFRGENTESGVFMDRHWRHAAGWFAYDFNDPQGLARTLRVTYSGFDSGRNFDILVNGQPLATVALEGKAVGQFIDVDYPLPPALGQTITVKFRAHPGSMAGGVFDIRILK